MMMSKNLKKHFKVLKMITGGKPLTVHLDILPSTSFHRIHIEEQRTGEKKKRKKRKTRQSS